MPYTRQQLAENYDVLRYMVSSVIALVGPMGVGKSTCAVALAWWMKLLFEMPVVTIATSMGLTDKFGPSTFLSLREFIEQLKLMTVIAQEIEENGIRDPAEVEKFLAFCKQTRGLLLYRAILLTDEMQKTSTGRRASDPVNMALLEFVDQMRHYHCTMITMTPRFMNLDPKLREQTKWQCRPRPDPETRTYYCEFRGPQGKKVVNIYGPKFQGKNREDPNRMFDSWAFAGFNMARLDKILEKAI